jgi:hypothetical protein
MPTNWRVYDNDTVVAMLDRSELPGFLNKSVTAGPNEAVSVIRNGHLVAVITEGQVLVEDMVDRILTPFTTSNDISVYVFDLSPFDITLFLCDHHDDDATEGLSPLNEHASLSTFALSTELLNAGDLAITSERQTSSVSTSAFSADGLPLRATCTIRVQADHLHTDRLLAILKGRSALASWDIGNLLKSEFLARHLVPALARLPAASITHNDSTRHDLTTTAREAVDRIAAAHGLQCLACDIHWAFTDIEQTQMASALERSQAAASAFAIRRKAFQLRLSTENGKSHLAVLESFRNADLARKPPSGACLYLPELVDSRVPGSDRLNKAILERRIREIKLQVERAEALSRLEQQKVAAEMRLALERRAFKAKHNAKVELLTLQDKEMSQMVSQQIRMATAKHNRELEARRHETQSRLDELQARIEERYQQRLTDLEAQRHRLSVIQDLFTAGMDNPEVLKTLIREAFAPGSSNSPFPANVAAEKPSSPQPSGPSQDLPAKPISSATTSSFILKDSAETIVPTLPTQPSPGSPQDSAVDAIPMPDPQPITCGLCKRQLDPSWRLCPFCGA